MFGRFKWLLWGCFFLAFDFPSEDIYDQKGYYLFPIRPGEINYLSGSMGELRSTHFHAGIDIKTGGVEGYTVYAAADGTLFRVKVSTGGYGKALYLHHPNNTFSVYAHLKDFSKEVADYVRREQYRKKSYEVDIFPPKGTLNFDKGDIIAASGNTGSSSAPHLHFEIRDGNHRILDPLRFDFPEIIDSRVPEIRGIAFRSLDLNGRVNGRFGRYDFDVRREGSKFFLTEPVELSGKVGVELYAFDRQDGTNNRYGLPCLEFYQGDELVYSHHIKTFKFSETRNLLVHTNYCHMVETRRRYHKLYIDDGNDMRFYGGQSNGVLELNDTMSHSFTLKIWDINGNMSEMNFLVNDKKANSKKVRWNGGNGFRVTDNIMELAREKKEEGEEHISIYANRFKYEVEPSYEDKNKSYYLWDLRDGLPDSVDYCGTTEKMNFKTMVVPGSEFTFFGEKANLEFGKRTLFDTLYLQTWASTDSLSGRETFHFNHLTSPMRRNVKVTLKPGEQYLDKDKTSVYSIGKNGRLGFVGGKWNNNDEITFYTRELVNFTLAVDSIPPTIKPVKVNSKELKFIIEDDNSGIKSYEALVDGKWVLMNYESKKDLIWSEKLNENIPFIGELILTIEDQLGNRSVYQAIL